MNLPTTSGENSRLMSSSSEQDQARADATPPINIRLITQQCLGSSQFALKLLAEFELTAAERMGAIEKESSALNLEKVGQIAHSLAGVASILAADTLSDIACRLQNAAEEQNLTLATDLILQLRHETDRVINYLPQFRQLVQQSSPHH